MSHSHLQVEVVLDAKHAPVAVPVKELRDRMSAPKATPKPATDKPKSATNGAATRGRGRGGRRGGKGAPGRRKPKTAEELDVEMDDYFGSGTGAETDGAGTGAAPATNGDGGMDDVL
jgi:THO complex subunit 4